MNIYFICIKVKLPETQPSNIGLIAGGGFGNYKKGYTRLTAASDKVYQLLAHGRWFSQGTPASSTTKTGRHDIAEILLKVALKHQNQTKSIYCLFFTDIFSCMANQR
jgi:hypothetical protein